MIDLAEMNSNFVTLDTLWLCLKVIDKPLISIVNESVVQYSHILKKAFFDLLVFLVHFNRPDFDAVPSIEGYVAARSKKLVHMGLIGNPEAPKPTYISLKPTVKNYLTCFRKSPLPKLKSLLNEFEMAYKGFEKALILDILKKGLNKI
jgi:hypothetical protein